MDTAEAKANCRLTQTIAITNKYQEHLPVLMAFMLKSETTETELGIGLQK